MTRPTLRASYRPHSLSRVEFNIIRACHNCAARIARNRAELRAVLAIVQATSSLININMHLQHRIEVLERQLLSVTINLHHILSRLAGWRARVRLGEARRHTWSWRNAVGDILRHSVHLGDNVENDGDSETEA